MLCVVGVTKLSLAHDGAAATAVREVQLAYGSQAICERVGVQVKLPPGASGGLPRLWRASFTVRYQAVAESGLSPLVTLDLGQFLLDATPSEVRVAHARDSTTYYAQAIEGQVTPRTIASVVPPLPLPQLDFARASAAGGQVCEELWPYASGITWTGVESDQRAPLRRTVRGAFDGGSVSMLLNGPRLRVLTIERTNPRVTITLSFSALGSCETDKTLVDPSKRTRVDTVLELKPRGGAVHVGDELAKVELSPAGGGEWSLQDLLDSPAEAVIAGVPPAEHAALVFRRVPGPGVMPPLPRMDFDKLGELLRSSRAAAFASRASGSAGAGGDAPEQMPRFGYALVQVFNTPDPGAMLEGINASGKHWGMRNVLFSAASATSLDLIAPKADAIVVIVDSKRIVRSVIAVDASTDADQLSDQIAGALFEVGAPRGMAPFVAPSEQAAPAMEGKK